MFEMRYSNDMCHVHGLITIFQNPIHFFFFFPFPILFPYSLCFSSLSLLSLTTNSSPVFFFTSQNPLFPKFFSFSFYFFFLRIFLCVSVSISAALPWRQQSSLLLLQLHTLKQSPMATPHSFPTQQIVFRIIGESVTAGLFLETRMLKYAVLSHPSTPPVLRFCLF